MALEFALCKVILESARKYQCNPEWLVQTAIVQTNSSPNVLKHTITKVLLNVCVSAQDAHECHKTPVSES